MTPTRATKLERIAERDADWVETWWLAWLKEARDLKGAPIAYDPKDKVEARRTKDRLMEMIKGEMK